MTTLPDYKIWCTMLVYFIVMNGTTVTAQENTWITVKQQNGVTLEIQQLECDMNPSFDQEVILLRLSNNSDSEMLVDWDILLWYNGICKTCDDPRGEYHRTVKLQAHEVKMADCSETVAQTFRIFVRFTDPAYKGKEKQEILTQYKFDNFKVTNLSLDK